MSAIYQPKGKAGEYAKYAVNFYVGCSNDCDYCEDVKVYWKDSVLEFLKMDKAYRHNVSPFSWRFDMSCHVDADYDMFH